MSENSLMGRLCGILLMLMLPFVGFAKEEKENAEESIVFGMTSGYAPYVSLNEKGEYEGFDIDVANLIAHRMHKKPVLKDLGGMTSLLLGLQKKKIDAVIWAMSITEQRQKEMEMVYYQGSKISEMSFLYTKEPQKSVKEIGDFAKLPNYVVCVEAGSFQDAVLQNYPDIKVRFMEKISDAIMEIKYGKANIMAIDNELVQHVLSQHPEIKVVYLPLPRSQQTMGNGICFHKENTKLATEVRKVVADLRAEGKIAELEKKWKIESR